MPDDHRKPGCPGEQQPANQRTGRHRRSGPEEKARLQSDRLTTLVRRLAEGPNEAWREKLAHVDPETIVSIADIGRLPFTTKQDLRDTYPLGMVTVPIDEVVRLHASSGTSGKPTIVAYTRADLAL